MAWSFPTVRFLNGAVSLGLLDKAQRSSTAIPHSYTARPELIEKVPVRRQRARAVVFGGPVALEQQRLQVAAGVRLADSQYTVNIRQSILEGRESRNWHNAPNSDLIARLRDCANRNLHTVLKIKAHQEIQSTMPDEDAYNLLGDQIADTAAKQAVHSHPHDLNQISVRIAATQAACCDRVRTLHDFMWDVHVKQWELLKDTDDVRYRPFRGPDAQVALVNWAVAESLPAPDTLTDSRLEPFLYGAAFGLSLCQWASALKWPAQKIPHDPGITFLELFINFLLSSGVEYPRLVGKTTAGGSLYQN